MRFTFVLVSVLAAAACVGESPDGGGPPGGGGGPDTPTDPDDGPGPEDDGPEDEDPDAYTASELLDEIDKVFCDGAHMCKASFPTDWGITFEELFSTSPTACYAQGAEDLPREIIEGQITAGKIKFDPAAAAACIAGLAVGTCPQYWDQGPEMPVECDTALVGTVADGGACITSYDCTSLSSYCNASTDQCTPYPPEP